MALAFEKLVIALQRIEPKPQEALAVDAYRVIAALECPLRVRTGPYSACTACLLSAKSGHRPPAWAEGLGFRFGLSHHPLRDRSERGINGFCLRDQNRHRYEAPPIMVVEWEPRNERALLVAHWREGQKRFLRHEGARRISNCPSLS